MKKVSLKGLRGQSPRKERPRPPAELEPLASGSEASKQVFSLPSPCSHTNSLCNPCFKTEQCSCCISLQSDCALEVKRKTKGGLFSTIRKKFSSPKHRELWDSSPDSSHQITSCYNRRSDDSFGSMHRKAPYRSRSAERPRSRNVDEPIKHAGSRSVQLNKRQLNFSLKQANSKRQTYRHSREQKSETDSEDSQIEQGMPKDVVPFDGYGHASAPFTGAELSVFEGTVVRANKQKEVPGCQGQETAELEGATMIVPAVQPFYDQVKDPSKEPWSLTKELLKLSKQGWYWGPINRMEAESKLAHQPDGAFLVRDSSDERYLLSLSFRSFGRTLHTRIEHCNGVFSFYAQPESEGFCSIVDLIEHSMNDSQTGVFCYSRARTPGSPSFPVRLTKPVSRFTQVRSLQYLCRFVIRQTTRVDHIQKLPLPSSIRGWLQQNQY